MGWGPPGVGKTEASQQIAEAMEVGFSVLTTNLLTLDDLTGLPIPDRESQQAIWYRPEAIPESGHGILLIDEITDGLISIQKCLYSLVLNHEVKGHKLGDGWSVICAGNRPKDGSGSSMLPSALITRMVHIGVYCDVPDFKRYLPETAETDLNDWTIWAQSENIRPEIIAYLRMNPDKLYHYQATPRTWTMASKLIDTVLDHGSHILASLLQGTIGPGPGIEFFGFLRLASQIPSYEAILLDPINSPVPADVGILHALTSTLVYYCNRSNANSIIRYADRLPDEFGIYLVTSCQNKVTDIASLPTYINWHNRHSELLT